jgi:hypothetical protein
VPLARHSSSSSSFLRLRAGLDDGVELLLGELPVAVRVGLGDHLLELVLLGDVNGPAALGGDLAVDGLELLDGDEAVEVLVEELRERWGEGGGSVRWWGSSV